MPKKLYQVVITNTPTLQCLLQPAQWFPNFHNLSAIVNILQVFPQVVLLGPPSALFFHFLLEFVHAVAYFGFNVFAPFGVEFGSESTSGLLGAQAAFGDVIARKRSRGIYRGSGAVTCSLRKKQFSCDF